MSRRRRRRDGREGILSGNSLSFTNKRVSKNALFTFWLGIGCLLGLVILVLIAVVTKGGLKLAGGAAGCIIIVLALFGVLWGLASYDEARTSQNFKIPGICLNIIVIFLGITFIML